MRNDLWTIAFSNPVSRDEILLDAELVVAVAEVFKNHAMEISGMFEGFYPPAVYLTGADRGSLLLSFLVKLRQKATRENLSTTKDALEVLGLIGGALWFALVQSGAVQADPSEKIEAPTVREAEEFGSSGTAKHAANRLPAILAVAGTDQVTISIPNYPKLVLIGEHSRQVSMIGSQAVESELPEQFRGQIVNVKGPIKFKTGIGNGGRELYWGNIVIGNENHIVLIQWGSERSIKSVLDSGSAEVEGLITPVALGEYTVEDNLPRDLKFASGILRVTKCFVGR